jgi:hypothetical protein
MCCAALLLCAVLCYAALQSGVDVCRLLHRAYELQLDEVVDVDFEPYDAEQKDVQVRLWSALACVSCCKLHHHHH